MKMDKDVLETLPDPPPGFTLLPEGSSVADGPQPGFCLQWVRTPNIAPHEAMLIENPDALDPEAFPDTLMLRRGPVLPGFSPEELLNREVEAFTGVLPRFAVHSVSSRTLSGKPAAFGHFSWFVALKVHQLNVFWEDAEGRAAFAARMMVTCGRLESGIEELMAFAGAVRRGYGESR